MLIVSWTTVSNVVTAFELASKARWAMIRPENSVEMLTFDSSSAPSCIVPRPPNLTCSRQRLRLPTWWQVAVTQHPQSLEIRHVGQGKLAYGRLLPVGINRRNCSVGGNRKALILSAGVAILVVAETAEAEATWLMFGVPFDPRRFQFIVKLWLRRPNWRSRAATDETSLEAVPTVPPVPEVGVIVASAPVWGQSHSASDRHASAPGNIRARQRDRIAPCFGARLLIGDSGYMALPSES